MTVEYLKKADLTSQERCVRDHKGRSGILDDIEAGGDAAALEYAAKFDKYEGEILLNEAEIEAASAKVPEKLKRDIEFAHANVKRFAEAQKRDLPDFEVEVVPGLIAGQKSIPVNTRAATCPAGATATSPARS
jgi:sulfopropanediol 3-dehydrogenase